MPPDDHLSTLSSIEETHEEFEEKTKNVKLQEQEIENMPVLKETRDREIQERNQKRREKNGRE